MYGEVMFSAVFATVMFGVRFYTSMCGDMMQDLLSVCMVG